MSEQVEKQPPKSMVEGVLAETPELNLRWWQHTLATLRDDPRYYRRPPRIEAVRQVTLF